jgi:shikimate kinase/3-dehydroquinate synthase
MTPPHIVITGFMGAGKTTVGRLVAQALQREFVDTDELLVTRAGKSISRMFADEGLAHMRARESDLCRELAAQSGLVIATGGGTLVADANRALLARQSRLFCLDAPPAVLASRLAGATNRPLLEARTSEQSVDDRIAELLVQREAAYALIPYHVPTGGQSPAQVAAQVIALASQVPQRELRRTVRAGNETYNVEMGAGIWRILGQLLRERLPRTERAAIVTDELVGPLYSDSIADSLKAAGFVTTVVTMPANESAKTLETAGMLYDRFIDAQLERSSVVLALGGGLVGDVAGFASATFLRGVNFVQLPTTALSVVDASLGGKTAVNHPKGKNLVGAFKQPVLVCADREALAALPVADFRSGLAEIVKHGIIGAPGLYEHLEREGLQDLPQILAGAIEVKLKVIESDPHERSERAVLNLGHTFGHAFETLSHYSIRHGEGVAMGLVAATRLAVRLTMCEPSLANRTEALLRRLGLPTTYAQYAPGDVLAAMATDKKKERGQLRFVLPVALGEVVIRGDVAPADVLAVLGEHAVGDAASKTLSSRS